MGEENMPVLGMRAGGEFQAVRGANTKVLKWWQSWKIQKDKEVQCGWSPCAAEYNVLMLDS